METEVDDAMLSFAVVACIRVYTHGTFVAIAEPAVLHAVKRLHAHFSSHVQVYRIDGRCGPGP